MSQPRDPETVIATWLEDGPIELPAEIRRAIAVAVRTQPRRRRMALVGGFAMTPLTRLVTAAAIALAVGTVSVMVLSNRGTGPGSSPTPPPIGSADASSSASASSAPAASVPELTQSFVSPKHGYSIRYPAGWGAAPATLVGPWDPAAPEDPGAGDAFDFVSPPVGAGFRAGSAAIPAGVVVDDWISRYITQSDVPACSAPRSTLEPVVIDGQQGRVRGFCGDATEIEATVVVANRVYVFTLFRGDRVATEADERALFDAFLATVRLNPAAAEVAASAAPSTAP